MWAGIVLAALPFGIWLVAHGLVREYFFLNWTLNAGCLDRFSFVPNAIVIVETQPAVCAFALFALVALWRDGRHRELAVATAVLLCQVLLARSPYLQYWIPLLPLLAIYAAHGLIRMLGSRPAMIGGLLAASAIAPVIVEIYLGETTNLGHLDEIACVLETAGPAEAVYDGDAMFNVFRRDVDYFWFSLGDRQMLESYRRLRPYELDIYDRIEKVKPKIISTFEIKDLDDARIRDHYAKSERYPNLLVRTR